MTYYIVQLPNGKKDVVDNYHLNKKMHIILSMEDVIYYGFENWCRQNVGRFPTDMDEEGIKSQYTNYLAR